MKNIAFICLYLLLAACSPDAQNSGIAKPSDDEIKSMTKKIFYTCNMRVIGREQKEGETMTASQSDEFTKCVDEVGAAYIEGIKAGHS